MRSHRRSCVDEQGNAHNSCPGTSVEEEYCNAQVNFILLAFLFGEKVKGFLLHSKHAQDILLVCSQGLLYEFRESKTKQNLILILYKM